MSNMWARYVEVIIGIWLGLSRFIFSYPIDSKFLKANDGICAILIILFSLITYCERFRYFHLFNFLVGGWLIGWVFISGTGVDFGPHQNYMVMGLLLVMLAIVPSRTKQPPKAWVKFLKSRK